MLYGISKEAVTLSIYKRSLHGGRIIVNHVRLLRSPWFAFSPDGFLRSDSNISLLEVKGPIKGCSCTPHKLIDELKYLHTEMEDGCLRLKCSNPYYTHIQLGLGLLGLSGGILLINCERSN